MFHWVGSYTRELCSHSKFVALSEGLTRWPAVQLDDATRAEEDVINLRSRLILIQRVAPEWMTSVVRMMRCVRVLVVRVCLLLCLHLWFSEKRPEKAEKSDVSLFYCVAPVTSKWTTRDLWSSRGSGGHCHQEEGCEDEEMRAMKWKAAVEPQGAAVWGCYTGYSWPKPLPKLPSLSEIPPLWNKHIHVYAKYQRTFLMVLLEYFQCETWMLLSTCLTGAHKIICFGCGGGGGGWLSEHGNYVQKTS